MRKKKSFLEWFFLSNPYGVISILLLGIIIFVNIMASDKVYCKNNENDCVCEEPYYTNSDRSDVCMGGAELCKELGYAEYLSCFGELRKLNPEEKAIKNCNENPNSEDCKCVETKDIPDGIYCRYREQNWKGVEEVVIIKNYVFDEEGKYSETWDKNLHIKYNEYFYGDFKDDWMDCDFEKEYSGKPECLLDIASWDLKNPKASCYIENKTICTKAIPKQKPLDI